MASGVSFTIARALFHACVSSASAVWDPIGLSYRWVSPPISLGVPSPRGRCIETSSATSVKRRFKAGSEPFRASDVGEIGCLGVPGEHVWHFAYCARESVRGRQKQRRLPREELQIAISSG
jgi:hypothetical protein